MQTNLYSWNTSAHIPERVLDKLHYTWPDLDISAAIVDRHETQVEAHRQMDLRLLSSPLLTRLTYAVYDHGSSKGEPSQSEWPQLSHALFPTSKLRYLSIQGQPDASNPIHRIVKYMRPETSPHLYLLQGADFSKLEKLRIRNVGYTSYLWDEKHCRTLRDSMDLFRLQTLDFGNENPEAFFRIFTGHVPNLKEVHFGITKDSSLEPAKHFIDSLSALTSLHVEAAKKGLEELWPIINRHRDTLKSLVLGPTWGAYYSPEYIDHSLLETIASTFPKLERLGWSIPFNDVVSIPPSHAEIRF